jgi:hypothetical protein
VIFLGDFLFLKKLSCYHDNYFRYFMFGKYNGFVSKARVSACMYFLVIYLIFAVSGSVGGHHWAILYYWRTCSASTSEAKNMEDLTPLPWLLVPRFMATTTVPTAVLSFRRCTSPPWFQHRYFMISLVFEVKIALKILIFFSYNLVDLQRWGSCLFAPLVDVWDVQEEYFYSLVRFLYILEMRSRSYKLQS